MLAAFRETMLMTKVSEAETARRRKRQAPENAVNVVKRCSMKIPTKGR
jgi:hypothetical protein